MNGMDRSSCGQLTEGDGLLKSVVKDFCDFSQPLAVVGLRACPSVPKNLGDEFKCEPLNCETRACVKRTNLVMYSYPELHCMPALAQTATVCRCPIAFLQSHQEGRQEFKIQYVAAIFMKLVRVAFTCDMKNCLARFALPGCRPALLSV